MTPQKAVKSMQWNFESNWYQRNSEEINYEGERDEKNSPMPKLGLSAKRKTNFFLLVKVEVDIALDPLEGKHLPMLAKRNLLAVGYLFHLQNAVDFHAPDVIWTKSPLALAAFLPQELSIWTIHQNQFEQYRQRPKMRNFWFNRIDSWALTSRR